MKGHFAVTGETGQGDLRRSAPDGEEMYRLVEELFPLNRSLTGEDTRHTLERLSTDLPDMVLHEVPSGTRVFDWVVPPEWNVEDAWVADESGRRVIDFQENNLHLVGYSVPVDTVLTLEELQPHLYSLPGQPDAIPYVTSYYERRWGFCLSQNARDRLEKGRYRVVVDSTLSDDGSLTYGELLLPGWEEGEVLLSTYVCHPSMANNELSGPAVTWALARWLEGLPERRWSYRVVFVPETIGALAYMSRNLEVMRARTIAGFVVTCVGDDGPYSFLASRREDTLADRAARHVLEHHAPGYRQYSYLDRGSDERQYGSPGADLPVVSVMRSKYATYPEYHTSLDDLSFVSPEGLEGSLRVYQKIIRALEGNRTYRTAVVGEPQMGRRGVYPTVGTGSHPHDVRLMMDLLAYSDGQRDLLDIARLLDIPMAECVRAAGTLQSHGLLDQESSTPGL